MPSNTAAWLLAADRPYEVQQAPYNHPAEDEIVIKAKSLALNPVDWAYQALGAKIFPNLKYPAIVGEDVAGDVVAVGSSVTRFQVGDRVVGAAKGAFQEYPVLRELVTSKIPASISYDAASVIPLAMITALVALFDKAYLGLDVPTHPARKLNGQVVFITGGSTSVGSVAVQMAVAAGYEVYSTSSARHFDYVKRLGATDVFDYNSTSLNSDVAAAFKGKTTAGAVAIGGIVPTAYGAILDSCKAALTSASGSKFVSLTMRPPENIPAELETKFVLAERVYEDKVLAADIWGTYLPAALEAGTFTPAPEPEVIGHGLEAIQNGVGKFQGPRSHTKLVVTI